jgi:ubiquinone/menaquinone biosynthesis C-methylase UbiE
MYISVKEETVADTPESRQLDLIREQFTESAKSFGDYALAGRVSEGEKLANLATADAKDSGNWRALDVACGPGTFSRALARRMRFVTCLDLTPVLLQRALVTVGEVSAESSTTSAFACGDGNHMPFADDSFDLAICGYSIHHMLHPGRVISELERVVRPGGRIALVDMVIRDAAHRAEHTRIERARDPSHCETLTEEEIREMLKGASLRVRASELVERRRNFDQWMKAMNVPPGTAAHAETRRLLMESMKNDSAGMRPRISPEGQLEYSLPSLYIVADKP